MQSENGRSAKRRRSIFITISVRRMSAWQRAVMAARMAA
jgi:hypothetical protein